MSHSHIHAIMKDKMDCIAFHEDDSFLLVTSGLTNRSWNGSVWYGQDANTATDPEKCTAGAEVGCGASDCCWIPKSSRFLLACDSGAVMLWDVSDDKKALNRVKESMAHDDLAVSISVSSDGKRAVSAGFDRKIIIWSLEEMNPLNSFKAHADKVCCVDCHPTDSDVYASCSQDGRLLLWDLRKTKPALCLEGLQLTSKPTVVHWHPSRSDTLAVGLEDGNVLTADIRNTSTPVISLPVHSRAVTRLAFSPKHHDWLASTSEDCMVTVSCFSQESAKIIFQDRKHTDFVRGLTWRPSDNHLFSASWDCTVIGREIAEMEPSLLSPLATMAINNRSPQNSAHTKCSVELMDTGILESSAHVIGAKV